MSRQTSGIGFNNSLEALSGPLCAFLHLSRALGRAHGLSKFLRLNSVTTALKLPWVSGDGGPCVSGDIPTWVSGDARLMAFGDAEDPAEMLCVSDDAYAELLGGYLVTHKPGALRTVKA